jgi:hypothetical protein
MSLRMSVPGLLCAVAIVAVADADVGGDGARTTQEAQPQHAVVVATPLARQGVAAGVVMCAASRDSPALDFCTELNGSLVEHRDNGVLHIRTSKEPRYVTELLNRPIDLEAASGVPAIEAVQTRIVNAVRGDHSKGISTTTSEVHNQLVTLRGGRATFMSALDDVVRQTPGLVWWVTFLPGEEGGYMVGLTDRSGGSGVGVLPIPKTPGSVR